MTKEEADFIGSMNMCDEISNEAYKKIMCHCEEQQPCEDCISRNEALRHRHIIYDDDGVGYSVVRVDEIEQLPSLTPQPKSGEWIITGYDYKCTNCEAEINGEINYMSKSEIKYCPYCGIKLEGEQDK